MKNTNLKIMVALFFGAMALISCKDLIDIIPKKELPKHSINGSIGLGYLFGG